MSFYTDYLKNSINHLTNIVALSITRGSRLLDGLGNVLFIFYIYIERASSLLLVNRRLKLFQI